MRKWETEYNDLKNGQLDEQIRKMSEKVDDKTIKKEEYKEYNKLLKVKENLPKVENILEYRNILQKSLDEIKAELKKYEEYDKFQKQSDELEKISKENEELSEKLDKILARKQEIQTQLKSKDLSEEEEEKVNKFLDKLDDNDDVQNVWHNANI